MKKIIFIALVGIFTFSTSNAQTKAKNAVKTTTKAPTVEGAGMLFDMETIDYGTVEHNSDGKREFVFVNNGNKPLIITSANGSCGCTVPTYPKDPIAPGAKAVIGVKYDTSRGGQPFNKTVTLKSNAVQGEIKVLTIKGTVLPAATTPAVETTKS